MKQVVLVGNPNCGKTTLFNGLTDSQQRVGNWPGVTIEKKAGTYVDAGETYEILDLPGVYELSMPEHIEAKDAQITTQVVASNDSALIINVIDACHLERHLYLTSQLLELGKPMVVVLNMTDIAAQRGIEIDTQVLSQQLACPVVTLQAHRQIGFDALRASMRDIEQHPVVPAHLKKRLPRQIVRYFTELQETLPSAYAAYRWMEQSDHGAPIADLDIVLADARYQMIHDWVEMAQTKCSDAKEDLTAKVDRLILNRFLALPIFFALMYGVFFLAIGVGGAFQTGFDIVSKALFVQGPEYLLSQIHTPPWLTAIITHGIGQALNTMLTFIPVLAVMYFLMAALESSGYMARAAFVVDRVMCRLGLPGQAFVPMIVGFGCNVPAIMAARTLRTERDRYLTVLMNPYMSCSARLAIYAVFVAAFFPHKGYQIIFSLYLTGIVMAVVTGYLVRHTLLKGKNTPLVLELPAYHRPSFRHLCRDAGVRLRYFLKRASRVILPVCIVLSILNAWSFGNHASVLAMLGQWLTPLFAPMGISAENWPAVVSLITGMLAKEVVIGTLNSLYLQMQHLDLSMVAPIDLWHACQQAYQSIYEHLLFLFVPGSEETVMTPLSSILSERFGSAKAAYAYLLFVLLYIPCVSTMAAIRQEATKPLMWASIGWSLVLAYGVAVLFYQMAIGSHVLYLSIFMSTLVLTVLVLAKLGGRRALSPS
ncbi:MAG: ferrous iron transport protein B [Gammaproteobacteria bacterium]|nr:ferrous iron transport protein B [Gammaproteobacteria bacterium]